MHAKASWVVATRDVIPSSPRVGLFTSQADPVMHVALAILLWTALWGQGHAARGIPGVSQADVDSGRYLSLIQTQGNANLLLWMAGQPLSTCTADKIRVRQSLYALPHAYSAGHYSQFF